MSKIFPFTGGGEGGSLDKIFFPVWTCIKPNLVSKIFPFTGGGGGGGGGIPRQKFFFQSEHVSSQIWCQKVFPLPWGRGVPRQNQIFPVWTCIKPNLVSKIFPFTMGEGAGGGPLTKILFSSLNMYQAKCAVKNFSLYWDQVPPPPPIQGWIGTPPSPPIQGWIGTPPHTRLDWDPPPIQGWRLDRKPPPPRNVNRQTPVKKVPSRHTTYAGGNNENYNSETELVLQEASDVKRQLWEKLQRVYTSVQFFHDTQSISFQQLRLFGRVFVLNLILTDLAALC